MLLVVSWRRRCSRCLESGRAVTGRPQTGRQVSRLWWAWSVRAPTETMRRRHNGRRPIETSTPLVTYRRPSLFEDPPPFSVCWVPAGDAKRHRLIDYSTTTTNRENFPDVSGRSPKMTAEECFLDLYYILSRSDLSDSGWAAK